MNQEMNHKPWFLISLYAKDPYKTWIQVLNDEGDFQFIGTSGTANWIENQGVSCQSVADVVGLNPRLQGKVKTLHPDLYTGIMAESVQDLPDGIPYIEGVCVDLTPFVQDSSFIPGKVDIGGPSLLRAASKSWKHVDVISSPESADYHSQNLPTDEEDRKKLAGDTIRRTLQYDKELITHFDEDLNDYDSTRSMTLPSRQMLRYGENPSQDARHVRDLFQSESMPYTLLNGKELSYTNCLDVEAAHQHTRSGDSVEVVVIKHTNPTGWASGENPPEVFNDAWSGDPKSAFGSIIGINRKVTEPFVRAIGDRFVEGVLAPEFSEEAIALLENQEIRALRWEVDWSRPRSEEMTRLTDGYLIQDGGHDIEEPSTWETVGDTDISEEENQALRQMWKVCRWVTSNAAVIGTVDQALGVGAGQQSRVDAVKLAVDKYEEHHDDHEGPLVLASDGFFPFPDNVEVAANAGVDAIVSPGGSVKDDEVLAAAERANIGMVFTHTRGFSH